MIPAYDGGCDRHQQDGSGGQVFGAFDGFAVFGDTKSASASSAELTASAASTAPITITTAIHSICEISSRKPAAITQTAAKQCIQALCSFVTSKRMPLKAYRKLRSRLRKVKPSFFIFQSVEATKIGKLIKTRSSEPVRSVSTAGTRRSPSPG